MSNGPAPQTGQVRMSTSNRSFNVVIALLLGGCAKAPAACNFFPERRRLDVCCGAFFCFDAVVVFVSNDAIACQRRQCGRRRRMACANCQVGTEKRQNLVKGALYCRLNDVFAL